MALNWNLYWPQNLDCGDKCEHAIGSKNWLIDVAVLEDSDFYVFASVVLLKANVKE